MGITTAEEAMKFVDEHLANFEVVVFSKSYCPYCVKAKKLLKKVGANAQEIELDEMDSDEGALIQAALKTKTKQSTVPNIFISQKHIGGCDDLHSLDNSGKLKPLLKST